MTYTNFNENATKEVQKGLNGSLSKAYAEVKVINLQFETLLPP